MEKALTAFSSRFKPPPQFGDGKGGFATSFSIPSLTGSSAAFLAYTLANPNRVVLAITPGIPEADVLADDLRILTAKSPCRILELPPPLDDDHSALGQRLKTIAAIRAWEIAPYPLCVVAAHSAIVAPIAKRCPSFRLKVEGVKQVEGGRLKVEQRNENLCSAVDLLSPPTFSSLSATLIEFGYRRVPMVENEGDYSIRGGIVDAWSPGDEFPIRAEFFGNDLESIRQFNPATQTSIGKVKSVALLPVNFNNDETCQFTDILPKCTTVLAIEHNNYSLPQPPTFPTVYTGDPPPAGVPTYDFVTTPLPGFAELGVEDAHHPELFDAAKKRLEMHLTAADRRGDDVFRIDELSGGFEVGGYIVATKADRVFTKHKARFGRTSATAHQGQRISDFEDLEVGEYVVHLDYGIGKYVGTTNIEVDGHEIEVFTVEYANGGKLHIPAEHAHLLTRYVGVKGTQVHLHSLDDKRWDKEKSDTQKAVADLAASLLTTQAKRSMTPGFAFDVNCDDYDAFEAAFPYEETADQKAAISAVLSDMANTKPMDRLICGDAGYGKTEVAMRAAYIAAMNGKQVALLAPTTVLAEQHFESFSSRFDGTPLRIESVSRFQGRVSHQGTFQRLANGVCDIVIGTHAILSKRVVFHDLGLIIIDEEQRFGVRQKEFLKNLRATADILTLSATPIPRTLYMSMTGTRDLSLIRTPPRERVAVDTQIVRDNDELVKSAIETELARSGQVFFLHNRVASIGSVETRLRKICPKARIVTAHGQMDTHTLAVKMRDFERGKYDILLSTTIIESGIDIPRANTILVNHADQFGMADLYQLRGRVGRSSRQGHAYFLLPPSGSIDSEARERLTALKKHGGLGSGFNLAVRDLEIRGAGNLLGSQQSGHIAAVGFTLYCQLLQRTIAKLKGEKLPDIIDVKLNLDFIDPSQNDSDETTAASLSHDYIEDDSIRMSFLRRIAESDDATKLDALKAEMRDRFGPVPKPTVRLLKLAELRITCAKRNIAMLNVRGNRAFCFRDPKKPVSKVIDIANGSADRKIAALIKNLPTLAY